MALDLHNSFGLPLLAQAFAFRSVTDRAVALAAVEPIKQMALFAVRLLGIDISHRRRVTPRVLAWCHGVQVLRVDAIPDSAGVVHNMSVRDLSVGQPHGHPMGLSSGPTEINDAVAVPIYVSSPEQAVTGPDGFGVEALNFCWGRIVHSQYCIRILPQARMFSSMVPP